VSYSGEAAEQVVRMSLEGVETAAKLSGAGARQVARMLYGALSDASKTKGKTRLNHLLRTGRELKVYPVAEEDLAIFCREARRYGVLYCALKDKEGVDGRTDIIVRREDAGKVARIFERYSLTGAEAVTLRTGAQPDRGGRDGELGILRAAPERQRERADAFLDALAPEPDREVHRAENPPQARSGPSGRSGPSSGTSGEDRSADRFGAGTRRSVRQELRQIRAQLEAERADRAAQITPRAMTAAAKLGERIER